MRHHLIDLIDPVDAYSAARFRVDAMQAIADIRSRGAVPLLVGGTMLYFKALRDGLSALFEANAAYGVVVDGHGVIVGLLSLEVISAVFTRHPEAGDG